MDGQWEDGMLGTLPVMLGPRAEASSRLSSSASTLVPVSGKALQVCVRGWKASQVPTAASQP